mgnify:FL=1
MPTAEITCQFFLRNDSFWGVLTGRHIALLAGVSREFHRQFTDENGGLPGGVADIAQVFLDTREGCSHVKDWQVQGWHLGVTYDTMRKSRAFLFTLYDFYRKKAPDTLPQLFTEYQREHASMLLDRTGHLAEICFLKHAQACFLLAIKYDPGHFGYVDLVMTSVGAVIGMSLRDYVVWERKILHALGWRMTQTTPFYCVGAMTKFLWGPGHINGWQAAYARDMACNALLCGWHWSEMDEPEDRCVPPMAIAAAALKEAARARGRTLPKYINTFFMGVTPRHLQLSEAIIRSMRNIRRRSGYCIVKKGDDLTQLRKRTWAQMERGELPGE